MVPAVRPYLIRDYFGDFRMRLTTFHGVTRRAYPKTAWAPWKLG
jgi:hypothetical protein